MRHFAKSIIAGMLFVTSPRVEAQPLEVIPLGSSDLAAASLAMVRQSPRDQVDTAPTGRAAASRAAGQARLTLGAPPDDDSATELVLVARSPSRRAEVELGALGGGRAEAPSLLHVGLGIAF